MKSLIKLLSFAVLLSVMLVACAEDDKPTNNNDKELIAPTSVLNINTFKPETGDTMTYFSLRENKVIEASKASTTEWDICFHRTNIYVNQGFRGPGLGGAFVLKETDFETLEELPADSIFNSEVSATVRAIPTGSGKGWYNYNFEKMEITSIPGVVLAIRTADGKYAKVKILSYYEGYPNNIPTDVVQRVDKTFSFKFVYQPDGTKSFKE